MRLLSWINRPIRNSREQRQEENPTATKTAERDHRTPRSPTKDKKRVSCLSNQPMENQGNGNKIKKFGKVDKKISQKGVAAAHRRRALAKKQRNAHEKQQLTGALLLRKKNPLVLTHLRGIKKYFPTSMIVTNNSAMEKNKKLIEKKMSEA